MLNPDLFNRLRKYVDPGVVVAREGMPFEGQIIEELVTEGGQVKKRSYIEPSSQKGEEYRVRCFAGETEVATPQGDRQIRDLVGISPLLIPNAKGLAYWADTEVRHFGRQPLLTLTIRRRRVTKKIRVTPDHRWLTIKKRCYVQRLTSELEPGDKLGVSRARLLTSYGSRQPEVSSVGVQAGFTFGDGGKESDNRKPAKTSFHGNKKALLPYFKACRKETYEGLTYAMDLPRAWKELPDSQESLSYLLGWLAGYFAADGSVAQSGTSATINSVSSDNLNFVKGILYQFGVRTSRIGRCMRVNDGCVPGSSGKYMYKLCFPTADLPATFWLKPTHKNRIRPEAKTQMSYWTVVDVKDHGEIDDVYCAVVPGIERFTLADNLITMNCSFCGDNRRRLYINHTFGTHLSESLPVNSLIKCFNQDCFRDNPLRRQSFMSRLRLGASSNIRPTVELKLIPASEYKPINSPADLPELTINDATITTLADLATRDPRHAALKFLRNRFIPARRLVELYQVSYISGCWSQTGLEGRLYCPIIYEGRTVGWQARLVRPERYEGELRWITGTGTKTGMCWYGWDLAKSQRIKILVEGPSDVWNIGINALGCFKKTISAGQSKLLASAHRDRDVYVVMFDPEQPKNELLQNREHHIPLAVKALERHRALKGRVIPIWLPEGQDPGSICRHYASELVRSELKGAGLLK